MQYSRGVLIGNYSEDLAGAEMLEREAAAPPAEDDPYQWKSISKTSYPRIPTVALQEVLAQQLRGLPHAAARSNDALPKGIELGEGGYQSFTHSSYPPRLADAEEAKRFAPDRSILLERHRKHMKQAAADAADANAVPRSTAMASYTAPPPAPQQRSIGAGAGAGEAPKSFAKTRTVTKVLDEGWRNVGFRKD